MSYVLAKFVRRHRVGALAGAAVALALMGGVGLAWWQAGRADLERRRAEQVKGFLTSLLRDASPYHAGDVGQLSAVDLMRQAWERMQATPIAQPEVRVELTTLIGESLVSLGDYDRAEPVLASAASLGRAELGDTHVLTLGARLNHAQMLRLRGRIAEQHQELQAMLPLLRQAGRRDPVVLVHGLQHLALNATDRGVYAEAEASAAEGFALAHQALGDRHPDTAASAIMLAFAHRYAQHFDAAVRQGAIALQLTEVLYVGPALHPRRAEARAVCGVALAGTGELAAGIAQLQQAIDETIRLFGADAPSVGTLRQNLVAYELDLGELERAERNADEALRLVRLTAAPGSYPELATALSQAHVRLEQGRAAEALPLLQAAAPRLEALVGPAHDLAQRAAALLVRA
jgi:serine/threonine-protein kinase